MVNPRFNSNREGNFRVLYHVLYCMLYTTDRFEPTSFSISFLPIGMTYWKWARHHYAEFVEKSTSMRILENQGKL